MTRGAPDDIIICHHTIHLSWLDRLRVLVGRPIHLDTRQDVWKPEGRLGVDVATPRTSTWVAPILPRRRPPGGGYAVADAVSAPDQVAS